MIPVKLANLSISKVGFVLMLKGEQDERVLPVFVGLAEAQAVAAFFNNEPPNRPLAHDLLKSVLDALEGRLERVLIHDLREGVFYGELELQCGERDMRVDCRPSDGVALALRCGVPIFVAEEVMDEAGAVIDDPEAHSPATMEDPDPLTELRQRLQSAIQDERYEEAAVLRDQIRRETSE